MVSVQDLQPLQVSALKLFFKSQFCTKATTPPPSTSLAGQTALITGRNIGIGLECARVLLDLQLSHLILAVRSTDRGEEAAAPLRKTHSSARIDVWALDMLSYESIQAFVERCTTSLPRLDIAILNAGVILTGFNINRSTGHEVIFQVNYLSTALLATLMVPVLKDKSGHHAPGRLTIVSSGMALLSKFANRGAVPLIPSFGDPKGWNLSAVAERYSVTKTMLLMFVQGAWMYVDAAVVKGAESHGCFVMDWSLCPNHTLMYTPEGKQTTERLWEETLEELRFANVRDILSRAQSTK
ncbi:NAD(P)-binding protein [Trematosphaeria pertusa]|uniref:NAD(P)-binding protein n=1 Tax=Trematosphaeria pertusa TaxID=390896 RepID=A0A6A6HYC3_9PLEO|nr:NAD(P)-binding protein [Trematosphaeria pertusa]KAF2243051.1 NAD(P)-binding protein [Trematosphaeria pertusa]